MQSINRFLLCISLTLIACGAPEDTNPADQTAVVSQELSATENWGVVEISPPGISDGSTMNVENVGGGTWNYGHDGDHCWSHYVHNEKRHSATAILGSSNRKIFANAGEWANADITGGGGGCKAYWSTY
jgi:lactococcin 972 family bacteriocin